MAREEERPLLNDNGGSDHASSSFDISTHDLTQLVDPKNPDLLKKLGGVQAICKKLRVDPKSGLSADEGASRSDESPFKDREQAFGRNVLPEAKSKSFLQLLWAAYNDKTLIMLTIASFVSLAVGIWEDYSPQHPPDEPRVGWVEGTAILVAVLAVVLTNAINDYQKEVQFKKLNAKKDDRVVKVLRGGREKQVSVYDIQVGEVLMLEPGDIIPVDGLYLEGHNLACDESSATGESDTMKKKTEDKGDCFILSGSKVLEGVARAVVIAVGENSFYGKTMMSMRGEQSEGTPLQMKLDTLAEQIAKLGFAAAVTMLITLIVKYFVQASLKENFPAGPEIAAAMISIVIQAITIIVVAVPEGLPMAVTMALAFATTQMLKDNNLVRVLAACETMGNATAICSDKTGTLTQNKMTVTEGTLAQEKFDKPENSKDWAKKVDDKNVLPLIMESIAINSTAFEGKDENGNIDFIGSKTECALLGFAKNLGCSYEDIRSDSKVAKVYPFASKRKTMTTIIETKENSASSVKQADYRIHVKGASEIVLGVCSHYMDAKGESKKLDKEAKVKFDGLIGTYADKALRTIALAYRDINSNDYKSLSNDEPPLEKLTLIGIVGIMDPLRPGVVESVAAFRQAGVFVRMITGDNINTAKAIARNAGILTKGGVALTGPELREMSVEKQREVIPRLQVLARSSPTDKTVVVTRLQEQDQVVGMTGDGTNDGPALKLADVGFSMGITGTEVAKEASDIILMDDNFNSILKALLWGRAVNDGVRKFLTFQLTVNIAAVILSFISAVSSDTSESILSAVQLLWVNLIMDTLAALALATEPPTDELLSRKPISKYAHLINFTMAKMILGQAIFQIIVNLCAIYLGGAVFHLGDSEYDQAVLRTMVFNIFVFLQVFNEINCRRIDGTLNVFKNIFDNWIFLAVQVAVIGGQILIVTFGGIAFKTVPLSPLQWLITVAIGSLSIPVGMVIRLLPNFGLERKFNEEARPLASYSRMNWEGAIGDVRNELRVYSLLRRSRNRKMPERQSSTQTAPQAYSAPRSYGATSNGQSGGNRFAALVQNAKNFQQAAEQSDRRQNNRD
ncbi:PMCA-type calcium-translocating P-type ATPase [Radiomyces spectabilis]|uniref:PMCA-type calcium-translocating P-type ATPase n=1 Tax=Radiomyces spectabilis TaxID=64574 RepID=UPI00221EFB3E|nr:PMCA-type calcium-translocating P-type ATPase [Radiomyces spectabilis]KAI8388871.1 PMCA-type calcium-translocating P-type ATPase [Radiomyces spectabilis]